MDNDSRIKPLKVFNAVQEVRADGRLKIQNQVDLESPILSCRLSLDGRIAAFGCANDLIKIYSVNDAKLFHILTPDGELRLPITCIRFLKEQSGGIYRLIATYVSGFLRVWDVGNNKMEKEININNEMYCCDINCTQKRIALGCESNSITILDLEDFSTVINHPRCTRRDVMDGHASRVFALKYHPTDEHILLSGGWDNTIQIWDDRQELPLRKIYGSHVCGDAIDIDPATSEIFVGNWRRQNPIQVWDFETGSLLRSIPLSSPHEPMISQVYCLKLCGRDLLVCGGSQDSTFRIIDKANNLVLGKISYLPDGVCTLDFADFTKSSVTIIGSGNNAFFVTVLKP